MNDIELTIKSVATHLKRQAKLEFQEPSSRTIHFPDFQLHFLSLQFLYRRYAPGNDDHRPLKLLKT